MRTAPRARRVRRVLTAAVTAAATAATTVAVSAGAAPPPAGADAGYFDECPAIVLYGSRGSGEPGPGEPPIPGEPDRHGLGLAIWELYEALAATRPAGQVGYVANDYPAVDPVDALPDVGPYVDSVDAGVARLRTDLPAIAAECPAAKIAVVGYSQGADVTRRGVDAVSNPGGRMKVFQLSDPHFDAGETTVAYTGNYDPAWRGLARNLADMGLVTHAPTFRAEWGVESWCHGADLVCQFPAGTLDTHVDYLERDVPAVAWRIARWAGLGSTTPIPVAYAEGVSCVGSFPSRNRATFRLSAAGSPPGTSLTLRAVVDTSTQVPAVATLGPTGSTTWTPELPFGTRPRYRVYWGNVLLLDQHMPPAC